MVMTFVVFAGYALLSAGVRERVLERPVIMRWVQRTLGSLLIAFGLRLATADR